MNCQLIRKIVTWPFLPGNNKTENMDFKINPDKTLILKDFLTGYAGSHSSKKDANKHLSENIEKMKELQDMLYAHNQYSILLIFQAMDTAGKDGAIKHVMSGLNPQGTQVRSFKAPTDEELNHDYLWRGNKHLPERGNIGIFNRSYYEEVLVVKVHNLLKYQLIPSKLITEDVWEQRYRQIRDYEQYLTENGTIILKFFLHISKEEQKDRLLQRIDNPAKNWKFSKGDIKERQYWDQYQKCYEEAIMATSTENAPWYVIPSDKKWFARLSISEIIVDKLKSLDIGYPTLEADKIEELENYRNQLMAE